MSEPLPRGLVFFSSRLPAAYRRRRLLVAGILGVATIALIWPVYPFFGGIRPFVLGLPFSFAWVILWLLIVFFAFAWLYRSEGPS